MKTEQKFQGMSLRDKLNSTSTAKIIINGHEIMVCDYMKDPKHYNSLPMKEEYVKEIIEDCEKAKEDKERLMDLNHYIKIE